MAKNLGRSSIYYHANMETESPSSTQFTRFVVLYKFKKPHLESYNGSRSPIDHIRALTTNVYELYYLAFPSTLKGLAV